MRQLSSNNVNEVDSTESTLPGYYLVADFHQPLSLTLDSRDQWQSTGPVTRSGHTPTGY